MQGPVAAYLDGGARLHLQHGPIDLIIGAEGGRAAAFDAARARFETVLHELVAELPRLRRPLGAPLTGSVARRMARAVRPHEGFVTPMAAVAGAVADEVLAAMRRAAPLHRAYVNNGGDIALHLAEGARFRVAMAMQDGAPLGYVDAASSGGIATSGAGGRSLSLGIADSVTVLAHSAAAADAAATLIANAVDLPDHPAIRRARASALDPDSDLGERLVVTGVARLSAADRTRALRAGLARAEAMHGAGLIQGAALALQGDTRVTHGFAGVLHAPAMAEDAI